MISYIFTNLLPWFVQVALGALVAVACYYLVRVGFTVVHLLGWLVTAYFIYRYGHGLFLSIDFVREGDWKEIITAFINVFLGLTTIGCALRGRLERAGRIRSERKV